MLIKVITSRKSLFHSIALALALIKNCLSLLLPGFDKHIYFRSIYHPFCECTTHSVTRCCYSNKCVFPLQSSTECQVLYYSRSEKCQDWKDDQKKRHCPTVVYLPLSTAAHTNTITTILYPRILWNDVFLQFAPLMCNIHHFTFSINTINLLMLSCLPSNFTTPECITL